MKASVLLGVQFLHDLIHRLLAEKGHFSGIGNPEIRRDIQLIEIFPHQLIAKAVNRADMGAVQQNLLALKLGVRRICLQKLSDSR